MFVFEIGKTTNAICNHYTVTSLSEFPDKRIKNELSKAILRSLNWSLSNQIVAKLIADNPSLDSFAYVKDVGFNYWTKGRGKTRGGSIAQRVLYEGDRIHDHDLPYIKGRDLDKYYYQFQHRWLTHDYEEKLSENDTFRFSADFLQRDKKIVYRQTSSSLCGTIDTNGYLVDKTLHIIVWRDAKQEMTLEYLLGIFNSKLFNFIYSDLAQEKGRAFAQVKVFRIKTLPIRKIDFHKPEDAAMHDKMVELVSTILDLHSQRPGLTAVQRAVLEQRIEAVDREIDALVYALYGLSGDEVGVVEGG